MAERILALDIGASSLKLAEFVPLKSGGIELVRYAVESLGVDPQSEADRGTFIVTTLREMVHESGMKAGRLLISVSGQSVFSRFVKLPPVDKDKVYQIVLYEAQQNVPFPMNELVWDYQLIGGTTGEIDVMLAAIKADIIEKFTDCVEAVGFEPDLVDVAPMALYNAVRFNYPDLPQCTLVIDMGARSTDLIFLEEGRVFSRSIPVAGNAITQQIMTEFGLSFDDAEQMKMSHAFVAFGGAYEGPKSDTVDKVSKSVRNIMTRMHAEINRSINFYRSQQSGQQPSLVLLTGGTSVIPYTDSFLKEKLKLDVDYLNPFLNVAVSETIEVEQIGRHAHVLGQVVGLALRRGLACPIELNLMPTKVLAEKAFRRKQPFLVAAAAGIVLVLAVWCGYFVKMAGLAGKRLEKVQERVAQFQGVERQMQGSEAKMREVENNTEMLLGLVHQRTAWLRILNEINSGLPEGMWLTVVRPVPRTELAKEEPEDPRRRRPTPGPEPAKAADDSITTIEISGMGYRDKIASSEVIREFRDKLRAGAFFSDQTEIQRQPPPRPEDYTLEFKIYAVLKEPLKP